VRVGKENDTEALAQPHTRPMDFTDKPMAGWVYVSEAGLESDEELARWVQQGVNYALSLTNGRGNLMRIHRDTRFSQDNTPYKTAVSGLFWQGDGKKTECPALVTGHWGNLSGPFPEHGPGTAMVGTGVGTANHIGLGCLFLRHHFGIQAGFLKFTRPLRAKCQRTFSERQGTPLFRLGYPIWVVVLVLSLLAGAVLYRPSCLPLVWTSAQ
jgi:hypothetical protein